MIKEARILQVAFLRKEQNQNFVLNIERLKAEGSVTPEQYTAMKAGYQQNLTAAVSEIANVKNQLRLQLQMAEQNLSTFRAELEALNIRHRVGELSLQKYQSSQQRLMRIIRKAESSIAELQRLIAAKSSAQIGPIPQKVEVGVPFRGVSMPALSTEAISSPLGIASLVIAGVMVISVFLPWVSFPLLGSASAIQAGGWGFLLLFIPIFYGAITFLSEPRQRGIGHLIVSSSYVIGCVALVIIGASRGPTMFDIGFGELFGLLGFGFWLYATGIIAGIVVALYELRES